MTHKQLVQKAKNYLLGTGGCTIAIAELTTTSISEIPDVIGFTKFEGKSILLECKVTREDFLQDKKKSFRQYEEDGLGDERYFYVPKGLLFPDEIPDGWGLLAFDGYRTHKLKKAEHKESNKTNEVSFLCSVIRRLQLSTCVYVVPDILEDNLTPEVK
jgi:hypothetical protein